MRAGILLIVLYWALFTIRAGLQPKVAAAVKAATYDMKRASGAAVDQIAAAEELRDIARVLSITANTDANIREAIVGILNIAERLERGK